MAHADDGKPWGVCDPNTAHQVWTEWNFVIDAHRVGWHTPVFSEVKRNLTTFFSRTSQGHSAELSIVDEQRPADPTWQRYLVDWRVDDTRALDPVYREHVRARLETFVHAGLGTSARVRLAQTSVLAGDQENGRPRAQLIVMPSVIEQPILWGQP